MFSGNTDECALYSSSEKTEDRLIDFVRWGKFRDPIENSPFAPKKKDGMAIYDQYDQIIGDPGVVLPGGSLARLEFNDYHPSFRNWYVCPPNDTSLGKKNRPPIPVWETDEFSYSHGSLKRFYYEYVTVASGCKYLYQIAADMAFEKIVVSEYSGQEGIAKSLDPGTYYCRVRWEYNDDKGEWSDTMKLTVNPRNSENK